MIDIHFISTFLLGSSGLLWITTDIKSHKLSLYFLWRKSKVQGNSKIFRKAKPSQAKPSQAKPSQAKPSQGKPSVSDGDRCGDNCPLFLSVSCIPELIEGQWNKVVGQHFIRAMYLKLSWSARVQSAPLFYHLVKVVNFSTLLYGHLANLPGTKHTIDIIPCQLSEFLTSECKTRSQSAKLKFTDRHVGILLSFFTQRCI